MKINKKTVIILGVELAIIGACWYIGKRWERYVDNLPEPEVPYFDTDAVQDLIDNLDASIARTKEMLKLLDDSSIPEVKEMIDDSPLAETINIMDKQVTHLEDLLTKLDAGPEVYLNTPRDFNQLMEYMNSPEPSEELRAKFGDEGFYVDPESKAAANEKILDQDEITRGNALIDSVTPEQVAQVRKTLRMDMVTNPEKYAD